MYRRRGFGGIWEWLGPQTSYRLQFYSAKLLEDMVLS